MASEEYCTKLEKNPKPTKNILYTLQLLQLYKIAVLHTPIWSRTTTTTFPHQTIGLVPSTVKGKKLVSKSLHM